MAKWDGVERRIEERRKGQIQKHEDYPKWVDGSLVESKAQHDAMKKSASTAHHEADDSKKDHHHDAHAHGHTDHTKKGR